MECRLDEHLKFIGKTSDQCKCLRSALAEAYVDKRVAGKKGSTKYADTALPLQARNQMLREMDWWTFEGANPSVASTWFGLRYARLKGCSPSTYIGLEIWVPRIRDLGASCFGLRFRNYHKLAA